jgi:hypothetical protein
MAFVSNSSFPLQSPTIEFFNSPSLSKEILTFDIFHLRSKTDGLLNRTQSSYNPNQFRDAEELLAQANILREQISTLLPQETVYESDQKNLIESIDCISKNIEKIKQILIQRKKDKLIKEGENIWSNLNEASCEFKWDADLLASLVTIAHQLDLLETPDRKDETKIANRLREIAIREGTSIINISLPLPAQMLTLSKITALLKHLDPQNEHIPKFEIHLTNKKPGETALFSRAFRNKPNPLSPCDPVFTFALPQEFQEGCKARFKP